MPPGRRVNAEARVGEPAEVASALPAARGLVQVALLAATSFALACSHDPAPRPNVLLISIDSTCQDLLGAYGRRPRHAPDLSPSPNLDRLASEGVLFEDASSTTSWTLPAHVSMLTGLPALVHAVDIDMQTPDPGLESLAQVLAAEGYRTAGFFSGPYLDPRFGFARGFERYEACFGDALLRATREAEAARARLDQVMQRGDSAAFPAARRAVEEAEARIERLSHGDVSSEAVTRAGLEVLDDAGADGRPFFLFLHYFDAHYDYTPPAPFDTRFDADYTGEIDGEEFIVNPDISVPMEGDPFRVERVISDRDLEHVFALYEGELAWIDEQIGRVLARLEERGLADDTLVIVTSDHGDEFFEHDGLGHRKTLYEEVLRVPLILRWPGEFPAGRRVATPVSILSIVPTVLDLLEIDPDAAFVSPSLADLARGEGREAAGAGVMARLVYTLPAAQGYTDQSGVRSSVPVLQVFLTETYRRDGIKVYRRRRWTEFHRDMPMPEPVRQSLEERQASEKAIELVTWIDLEKHPRESERFFSREFDDPRARAVLQEFHDLYPRLLARRRAAGEADLSDMQGALQQLGYASGAGPDRATEAFEVPPPGAAILAEASPGRD